MFFPFSNRTLFYVGSLHIRFVPIYAHGIAILYIEKATTD